MESKIEFKIRNNFTVELEREWTYLAQLCPISMFQNYSWQTTWFDNINKKNSENSVIIISTYFNDKIISIDDIERECIRHTSEINIVSQISSNIA